MLAQVDRIGSAGFLTVQSCSELLGGFAGGFGLRGREEPAFPQVGNLCSEPRPQETAQKPRLMAKSGPIFCKTIQKLRGADIECRAVAGGLPVAPRALRLVCVLPAAIPIVPAAPGAPSLIRLLPVLRKRGQCKTAIV